MHNLIYTHLQWSASRFMKWVAKCKQPRWSAQQSNIGMAVKKVSLIYFSYLAVIWREQREACLSFLSLPSTGTALTESRGLPHQSHRLLFPLGIRWPGAAASMFTSAFAVTHIFVLEESMHFQSFSLFYFVYNGSKTEESSWPLWITEERGQGEEQEMSPAATNTPYLRHRKLEYWWGSRAQAPWYYDHAWQRQHQAHRYRKEGAFNHSHSCHSINRRGQAMF